MKNILLLILFVSSTAYCQLSENNIRNTSKYQKKGRYEWKIYIDASGRVLAQIDSVRYKLHPTFKIREVKGNKSDRFSYGAIGWGEFFVGVKVFYKNGRL